MERHPQPGTEAYFKTVTLGAAQKALVAITDTERGKRAAARLALAFVEAASRAKDPGALYKCSTASITACIAASIDTQINPGGPYPKAYLVPRGGQLNFEITHRGIAVVAQRAGYSLRAIPVHVDDPVLKLEFGEVSEHEASPDAYPTSLDQLRGVYVSMTRLSDGANMGRPWVPVSLIRKRAESRQAGPVWNQWPVEMAQKTAIKHCVARGMLVIDSDELDMAFASEPVWETTVEEAAPATTASRMPTARPDEVPETLRLPDGGDIDEAAEFRHQADRAERREPVERVEDSDGAGDATNGHTQDPIDRDREKMRIDTAAETLIILTDTDDSVEDACREHGAKWTGRASSLSCSNSKLRLIANEATAAAFRCRVDIVEAVQAADRGLRTSDAMKIRTDLGIGATTRTNDVDSRTLRRWHDALIEAEERAAMQADQ